MKQFYQTIRKSTEISILLAMISMMSFAGSNHFKTVWQGENGQNHMNFMIVSASFEDLPLSVDDEIAVFSGSNCVGTAKLTKTINANDNTTFVSFSASQDDGSGNGFISNDTIIFKIWDNLTQKEILTKAITYRNNVSTWTTNGKYAGGATAVVELVSFVELTQTIELIKGYNLISTYVTAKNPSASAITQSLRDQGSLVKMMDEAGNSYEDWGSLGGWIDKLGPITSTEGYKIKVADNCSFQVTGRPISLPLNIPLEAGWNIISFPRSDEVNALSVIQPLIDQNLLIKVQDEGGHSIENWGAFGGWTNNIGNFGCCKAYKIKVSADAILTINENYVKSNVILTKSAETIYFSTEFEGNGSDHMNINLVGLSEAGFSVGDELAAFDGNNCVGSIKLTDANLEQGSASLITSHLADATDIDGFSDGDQIVIHAWNKLSGNEFSVQSEVISGQMKYENNSSLLLNLKSSTTGMDDLVDVVKIEVYPNPSVGKITVRFSELPEQGSRIDILDLFGRTIASRSISRFAEEFNLIEQPAGIYLVKSLLGSSENIQRVIVN